MRSDDDFEDLFGREFPRLAGYCTGLVGDRELGCDLAQEALARTWARWAAVSDPRAYSYLVATNLARRQWRTRTREQHARTVLAAGTAQQPAPDGVVRDLVERLPDRLRAPTLLHYYADLPVIRWPGFSTGPRARSGAACTRLAGPWPATWWRER